MDGLFDRDGLSDRVEPEQAWAGTVGAIIVLLTLGSMLFPRQVYDAFLWQYFWGPVEADARGESCLARIDGETVAGECNAAIVAEPGYTAISTVSYAIVLVSMLVGVYFLMERLDIGKRPELIYALFPFVLFGGALRTIEDASLAIREAGVDAAVIPFPWTALIISPFIYFTVFAITVAALVTGVMISRRRSGTQPTPVADGSGARDDGNGANGSRADDESEAGDPRADDESVDDETGDEESADDDPRGDETIELRGYEYPTAAIGTALFLLSVVYLGWLSLTTDVLTFDWRIPTITLLGATVLTALVRVGTERWNPEIHSGTGGVGALIIWGHTVDGIANVLSLDWYATFGLQQYEPKHVVNSGVRTVTEAIQPAWLSDAIGITWPFLPIKIVAAVAVVALFNDEVLEESPRYSVLLLVTVLAVGLGPGTRDFLRASFGI